MQNAHKGRYESNCLTTGVTVEGELVLGTRRKTSDLVLQRQGSETGGEGSRGLLALETKDVGGKTSNVGSSHGGTRDGVLRLVSFCCEYAYSGSNLQCRR